MDGLIIKTEDPRVMIGAVAVLHVGLLYKDSISAGMRTVKETVEGFASLAMRSANNKMEGLASGAKALLEFQTTPLDAAVSYEVEPNVDEGGNVVPRPTTDALDVADRNDAQQNPVAGLVGLHAILPVLEQKTDGFDDAGADDAHSEVESAKLSAPSLEDDIASPPKESTKKPEERRADDTPASSPEKGPTKPSAPRAEDDIAPPPKESETKPEERRDADNQNSPYSWAKSKKKEPSYDRMWNKVTVKDGDSFITARLRNIGRIFLRVFFPVTAIIKWMVCPIIDRFSVVTDETSKDSLSAKKK